MSALGQKRTFAVQRAMSAKVGVRPGIRPIGAAEVASPALEGAHALNRSLRAALAFV